MKNLIAFIFGIIGMQVSGQNLIEEEEKAPDQKKTIEMIASSMKQEIVPKFDEIFTWDHIFGEPPTWGWGTSEVLEVVFEKLKEEIEKDSLFTIEQTDSEKFSYRWKSPTLYLVVTNKSTTQKTYFLLGSCGYEIDEDYDE